MPTYLVCSPLKTGGRRYAVGDPIELDDQTAAPLVARGRLTPQGEPELRADAAGDEKPKPRPAAKGPRK